MMEMVAANVGEVDRLTAKENVLRDFVRFSWRVTRGLSGAAESEGRELVNRMVQAGRVTSEQGERLMATLTSKMNVSREVFEGRVDTSVRKAVEKVQTITEREVSRLGEQLASLEKRLEKLATKPGK